ncbi:MAG TPA: L-glutamate gamma-semialdehyde dehydrogenase [Candidatus Dormibacteraeota bacterium]|jgi:1-pyrroline-5-carboxylate dehydrogenase|nr:L-glutamate gamma-semialdehyde dehydrogenase [Candidatus Dormibacteraeota bacterium]
MSLPASLPPPRNEPQLGYAPGSPERGSLRTALRDTAAQAQALPMVIGGREVAGGNGTPLEVRAPHDHGLLLGEMPQATPADVQAAVDAALAAWPEWSRTSLETRAAIFLRAADLLAGPWRDRINAATMLGQSKSVHQSEIDAACELIDFWRWNVHFAAQLMRDQPVSPPGVWNRTELRPLEGFVVAITPFNFTSIAGNLPTAPALMGNVVVWKPAPTQQLAASLIMSLLAEAGLPPGVVNMVTGHGAGVLDIALQHPRLAGVHFTGSTPTFHALWRSVSDNIGNYRTFPRLVGETGGKDFVVAHASASPEALLVGLLRGAFEYQGQKCSAPSRAYVPEPMWRLMRGALADATESLPMGDPADFSTFLGAVIDERAFRKHEAALRAASSDPHLRTIAGGEADSSAGWFVRPTIFETDDPGHELMQRELFGPILTVYPYPEDAWESTLDLVDSTSPYALTGAVFAQDRVAVEQAMTRLRDAAGNFYINDKPTGAVVGQQPFGGARASGTNDKAGSMANLARWVSPRSIKETFVPPVDWRYPHLQPD